jgi:hypothetical protein
MSGLPNINPGGSIGERVRLPATPARKSSDAYANQRDRPVSCSHQNARLGMASGIDGSSKNSARNEFGSGDWRDKKGIPICRLDDVQEAAACATLAEYLRLARFIVPAASSVQRRLKLEPYENRRATQKRSLRDQKQNQTHKSS